MARHNAKLSEQEQLNLTLIGMVPPQYVTEKGPAGMAVTPVGAGPYRVVEFVRDERVVLEPNPTYWGPKPKLTKVTFRPIPEPARAKQLLSEAGYPDGFETSLTTPQGRYMADKELSEAIAGQLTKVGVKAKVVVKDWSVITKEIGDRTLGPRAFMGLSQLPDATLLLGLYVTDARQAYGSYPEFDKLVIEARQTMDDGKRADLLRKAAEVMREEAMILSLHQQYDLYGYNKRVQSLNPTPDEWIDITKLSVK